MKANVLIPLTVIVLACFMSGCGGSGGGTPAPTPTPTPTPAPTISVSPTSATVNIGATQNFTLTESPSGTSTSCASTLFGTVPLAGNTATYAPPASSTPPSAFTDTLTCTATNSAGTATASSTITLEYPVPQITAVNPQTKSTIFLFGSAGVGNLNLDGTGFINASGATAAVIPDSGILTGGSVSSFTLLSVDLTIGPFLGEPWDPGLYGFTYTSPPGHGGGTSVLAPLAFLGTYDEIAVNATDVFTLDPNTGTVAKTKIADGSSDGSFPTVGVGPGAAIAIDATTGTVVVSGNSQSFSGVVAYDPSTGAVTSTITASGNVMGVTAGGGFACFAEFGSPVQGLPNVIACADITQTNPTPVTTSVFNTPENFPWEMKLVSLGGTLTLVELGVDTGVLATFSVPSLTLTGSVTLPIVTASNVPPLEGGWQLQVVLGEAAVSSTFDGKVFFVDLATLTQKNVMTVLGATIVRIGQNPDGSVVVATWNASNPSVTTFANASGVLQSTVPFLATGLQVSLDGKTIYGGNRGSTTFAPNQ